MEPDYVLAFKILGSGWVPSTAAEHKLITEGNPVFRGLIELEQAYDANVTNYINYEVGLTRFIVSSVVHEIEGDRLRDDMNEIARLLDILLSSSRAVVNFIKVQAKRIGGKEGQTQCLIALERIRENLFGFFAIENLRNAAQHEGGSLFSVSLSWDKQDVDSDAFKIVRGVTAFAKTNTIEPDRNAPLRASFASRLQDYLDPRNPEQVDLMPLIRQHIVGISRLMQAFRQITDARETVLRDAQLEAARRLYVPGNPRFAGMVAIKTDGGYRDTTFLSNDVIRRIDLLRKKNPSLEPLLNFQLRS